MTDSEKKVDVELKQAEQAVEQSSAKLDGAIEQLEEKIEAKVLPYRLAPFRLYPILSWHTRKGRGPYRRMKRHLKTSTEGVRSLP